MPKLHEINSENYWADILRKAKENDCLVCHEPRPYCRCGVPSIHDVEQYEQERRMFLVGSICALATAFLVGFFLGFMFYVWLR